MIKMKYTVKHFTATLLIIFCITSLSRAQSEGAQKIGYTNVDYILNLHPKSDDIEEKLKAHRKQLEKENQQMTQQLQQKYQSFQKSADMMSESKRRSKQEELRNMQERIQTFQQESQQEMQKKRSELLQPVLDEIQNAIDQVADKYNYAYILNSDAGFGTTPILLHGPEKHNVTDKILDQLGIAPPTDSMGPQKSAGGLDAGGSQGGGIGTGGGEGIDIGK